MFQAIEAHPWYNRCKEKRKNQAKTLHLEDSYTGKSVDAILDRLPTAKILSQGDRIFEIEAEVYGKGIVMWLLSQGERVEVIAPAHLREKMRDTLLNMLELYR